MKNSPSLLTPPQILQPIASHHIHTSNNTVCPQIHKQPSARTPKSVWNSATLLQNQAPLVKPGMLRKLQNLCLSSCFTCFTWHKVSYSLFASSFMAPNELTVCYLMVIMVLRRERLIAVFYCFFVTMCNSMYCTMSYDKLEISESKSYDFFIKKCVSSISLLLELTLQCRLL